MKKISIVLLICLFSLVGSCTDTIKLTSDKYPDYSGGKDPGGEAGEIVSIKPLQNPDRGFHLESNYFVHNLTNPFNKAEVYPAGFINDRETAFKTKDDALTLTQLYFYLTDYLNKDIPDEAFANMKKVFDEMQTKGYKAILRFAYNETGLGTSAGENVATITRHLQQLKPFIEEYKGQIAVWQVGFLGAWGEWHNTPIKDQADRNNIVNEFFKTLPEGYFAQLRYPDLKNELTLDNPANLTRIGFNNDYFTAGEHVKAPGNDFVPGDKWYKQACDESPYFFMSGEIPYPENSEWGLHSKISVSTSLKCLRDNHYSAFDVTQNNNLNIQNWKNTKVYPQLLKSLKILFSEDYFVTEEGNVSRSAYEFIRDHLGYRLNVLPSTTIKANGGTLDYKIEFTNTGFASILVTKIPYLVLIDGNNKVVKEIQLDSKPIEWQPFNPKLNTYDVLIHKIEGSIASGVSGKHKVGIWIPDFDERLKYNNLYDVKWVENSIVKHVKDADNKYLINVIGEVDL